jgi:metal-responsive CopG/Arc/MetJ family transcriptional regulator
MARINISIPDKDLDKVDRYKKLTNSTRSGLIRKAIESYFKELEIKILEKSKKEAIQDIFKIRDKIAKELEGWNPTGEIRKLRDRRWEDLQE